jgi:hypothetical protein
VSNKGKKRAMIAVILKVWLILKHLMGYFPYAPTISTMEFSIGPPNFSGFLSDFAGKHIIAVKFEANLS